MMHDGIFCLFVVRNNSVEFLKTVGLSPEGLLFVGLAVAIVKVLLGYLPELSPPFKKSSKGMGRVKKLESLTLFLIALAFLLLFAFISIAKQQILIGVSAAVFLVVLVVAYWLMLKYAIANPDPASVCCTCSCHAEQNATEPGA